jgi:ferredoxin
VERDVLRWPFIGKVLRWRHARTALQFVLLIVAVVVVAHGLFGPQIAGSNLATVLTWVHYRGLLVVVLLAAGNFFCTGCPFVLARDTGRRFVPPTHRWPRRLRTKWLAIGLFVAVLFAYELFDLWALPRATAWLVLAYFASAMAVDLVFTGATFCKYLCPIGQFNFVVSTMSPTELRVRQPETCRTCGTVDCIKGRRHEGDTRRGCELGLFLPLKVGNLDCTFCLDCVQACPHDNIALALRVPGAELSDARRRSGVGRLSRRWDLATLAIVFAFGGMLNAFAMVAPVYDVERWLSAALSARSEAPALAAIFVIALCVIPAVLLSGAAGSTRLLVNDASGSLGRTAVRYAYTLIPFGVGMWVAHYEFHLLTGALTIVPVAQSAAIDVIGFPIIGGPFWRLVGVSPGSVFPLQLGFVLLGGLGSLAVAYGISQRDYPERPGLATVPWALLTVVLTLTAIWILSQPMEMRAIGFSG